MNNAIIDSQIHVPGTANSVQLEDKLLNCLALDAPTPFLWSSIIDFNVQTIMLKTSSGSR